MSDEISIAWSPEGDIVTTTATLGEASVVIRGDLNDDNLATLINSAPAIMNAVVENINLQEDQ